MGEYLPRKQSGIACPECGSTNRSVIESRRPRNKVSRRCECDDCGAKFTTFEYRSDQLEQLAIKLFLDSEGLNQSTVVAARMLENTQKLRQHLENYLSAVEQICTEGLDE